MTHRLLGGAFATFAFLVAAGAQSPCPPQGITLVANGGRLGDSWSIDMVGRPSAFGIFGLDIAPGPTATPIGTICLGLSPFLATLSFTFDPAGSAAFGGLMPVNTSLVGFPVYVSAVAVDPAWPNNFAISNGASITPRQPRLYFINPGTVTPFGTTPGSLAALNVVTESVAFSQSLTTSVRDATFVRERGWLVLLLGNGTLLGLDGTTGAPVLNATLTGSAASASKLVALPGGNQLLLVETGTPPSPFGGGSPGAVHFVSLPSGTVATTVALAAGNPEAVILAPATPLALLRLLSGAITPVDIVGAFLYPTIPLPSGFGGLVDWQVGGNILYCLHSGVAPSPFGGGTQPAALSAVDLGTLLVLFTNPLSMPVPIQMLRAGPGTTGPSLYVYGTNSGTLDEFAQVSGAPTTSVFVGSGIAAMELSALGSQWLLLCNGGACGGPSLLSMTAYTTLVSPLQSLPPGMQPLLAVSPSAGYGKACFVIGSNIAAPFRTDPFVLATATTTLPISANLFRVVTD